MYALQESQSLGKLIPPLRVAALAALTTFSIARIGEAQSTSQQCSSLNPTELQNVTALPPARLACVRPEDLTRNISLAQLLALPPASIRSLNTAQLIALYGQFESQMQTSTADVFLDTLTNAQAAALPANMLERIANARRARLAEILTHCNEQNRDVITNIFNVGNDYQTQGRFIDALKIFQELYRCRPQTSQLAYNVAISIIEALGAVGILQPVAGYVLNPDDNSTHRSQTRIVNNLFNVDITRHGSMLHFPRDIDGMFSGVAQLRRNNRTISIAELTELANQLRIAQTQLNTVLRNNTLRDLGTEEFRRAQNSVAIMAFILTSLERILGANSSPANTVSSTSRVGIPPLTPPPSGRPTTRTVTSSVWPTVGMATGALAAGATAVAFSVMSANAGRASDEAFANCVRLGLNQNCPTRATIGDERDVSQRNAGLAVGAGVVTAGLTIGAVLLRPRTTTVQITGIGAHADNTSVGVSVSGTFPGL